MRLSAEQFSANTLALLVGVGRFERPGPDELYAAKDVARLFGALTDKAYCGIPATNVLSLTDGEATREKVLAAVGSLVSRSTQKSFLFVFLSGHGYRTDEGFCFHLFETDAGDPIPTGLTATALADALASSPARGILIVADCCLGAGLAETVPRFFSELRDREFCLAVAASRADQRSWDIPSDEGSLFAKHLLAILEGRTAAGSRPGEITHLDLIEGLAFAINEELTLYRPEVPRQELVANGWMVSNPLLFLSARAALRGLTIETGRVTVAHLRRTVRRLSITAGLALLLVAASYSAWMGAHQYALADAAGTRVFLGYPGLTGFGYPMSGDELGLTSGDYRPESPLANDRPLVTFSGQMRSRLEGEVSPVLRAYSLALHGQREAALELVSSGRAVPPPALDSQHLMATALKYRLAPRTWAERLEQAIDRGPEELRRASLLRLIEVDSDRALDRLATDAAGRDRVLDHREALLNLRAPCSPAHVRYFEALLNGPEWINAIHHLLLAWWQSRCPVEPGQLHSMVAQFDFDSVELVGEWARHLQVPEAASALAAENISIGRRSSFAIGLRDAVCKTAWLEKAPSVDLFARSQLLRYALGSCPGRSIRVNVTSQLLMVDLASEGREPVPWIEFSRRPLNSEDVAGVRSLLRLLVEAELREPTEFLIDLVPKAVPVIQGLTLGVAQEVGAPFRGGHGFFPSANDRAGMLAYYRWMRRGSAGEADRIAASRVGDPRYHYVYDYFGSIGAPPVPVELLLKRVRQGSSAGSVAAARLAAMFGDPTQLSELAASPNRFIRNALLDYVAFNSSAARWFAAQNAGTDDYRLSWPALRDRVEMAATLRQTDSRTDDDSRCLRILLLKGIGSTASALGQVESMSEGLRLLIDREAEACRASSGVRGRKAI